MKAQSTGPVLSTVFVDYDNIYLALKRKNEEAARRFAKDSGLWLKEIETGGLMTPTNGPGFSAPRRIVINRCYGNPVPRRNANDNSTDMNSFPFVRHHFQRAGFETIDCPPLTSQLKNSADIRMVMDISDLLNHNTFFDEFIILSSDADFTPVLHRLRAHARRTIVFATDNTAAPYTAISDGEVREASLIALLLEGRMASDAEPRKAVERQNPSSAELDVMRKDIVAEVVGSVRAAVQPVPLEALADRAVRALGHEKTVGSAWGGAGSFRDLLAKGLPGDVKLSDQPPYFVYDASRQIAAELAPRAEIRQRRVDPRDARYEARPEPAREQAAPAPFAAQGFALNATTTRTTPYIAPDVRPPAAAQRPPQPAPAVSQDPIYASLPRHAAVAYDDPPRPAARVPQDPLASDNAMAIQQSIARIHDACQAPPLSPPEYRVLFEVMAEEITTNNLAGAQTLANIAQRAREIGVDVRRDDVRFVLEVVGEADPWFEQGASANLFASRFRNFVVARCRSQGLNLSAQEIDLIDAWFGGTALPQRAGAYGEAPPLAQAPSGPAAAPQTAPRAERWPSLDEVRQHVAEGRAGSQFGAHPDDEFPRIIRTRLRG